MSFLEVIRKASNRPDPECGRPISLSPDPVFLTLKPECKTLVKRANGWEFSEADSEIIELNRSFFNKLKRKLKNPNGFQKGEFLEMLYSYLENIKEKNGILLKLEKSNEGYGKELIEKLGSLMGRDVKSLVLGIRDCVCIICSYQRTLMR